jgi:hypothetical protein
MAERSGNIVDLAGILTVLGYLALYSGELAKADDLLQRSLALHCAIGLSFRAPEVRLGLATLHMVHGDWEAAERWIEEASSTAITIKDNRAMHIADNLRAHRDILTGKPKSAHLRLRSRITTAYTEIELGEALGMAGCLLPRPILLAWTEVEMGMAPLANDLMAAVVNRARAGRFKRILVEALWVQSLAEIRQRRNTAAIEALEEALHWRGACPIRTRKRACFSCMGI